MDDPELSELVVKVTSCLQQLAENRHLSSVSRECLIPRGLRAEAPPPASVLAGYDRLFENGRCKVQDEGEKATESEFMEVNALNLARVPQR